MTDFYWLPWKRLCTAIFESNLNQTLNLDLNLD